MVRRLHAPEVSNGAGHLSENQDWEGARAVHLRTEPDGLPGQRERHTQYGVREISIPLAQVRPGAAVLNAADYEYFAS